jgi:hypothetical protein
VILSLGIKVGKSMTPWAAEPVSYLPSFILSPI